MSKKTKGPDLDWVRDLAKTMKEYELYGLSFETEDVSLSLKAKRRDPASVAPAQVLIQPELDDEGTNVELVRSQDVGIFRSTVALGVGEAIAKGQKLGTVESVSLQRDLVSHHSGRLLEFLASDGDPVEYGQPLFVLSTEDAHV